MPDDINITAQETSHRLAIESARRINPLDKDARSGGGYGGFSPRQKPKEEDAADEAAGTSASGDEPPRRGIPDVIEDGVKLSAAALKLLKNEAPPASEIPAAEQPPAAAPASPHIQVQA